VQQAGCGGRGAFAENQEVPKDMQQYLLKSDVQCIHLQGRLSYFTAYF